MIFPAEPAMRIVVDLRRCEGHGMCEKAAPELFELDEQQFDCKIRRARHPPGVTRQGRGGPETNAYALSPLNDALA